VTQPLGRKLAGRPVSKVVDAEAAATIVMTQVQQAVIQELLEARLPLGRGAVIAAVRGDERAELGGNRRVDFSLTQVCQGCAQWEGRERGGSAPLETLTDNVHVWPP
jgi:hypothetical protein